MSWSHQFTAEGGIRYLCRKKILEEIFYPLKCENDWKILVVDDFGMKVLTSCFKTEEVMTCNIALIENLEKPRESVPYLEAIYILYPSVENIGFLQIDFACTPPKYMSMNLFFLSSVSDDLLKELLKYTSPGIVQTFKEIDLMFLSYESQVFSLHDELFFSMFFDAYKEMDLNYCTAIAKKLVTFLSTLDVHPRIRYRRNFIKNFIFAEAVQREIHLSCRRIHSRNPEVQTKTRCELIILDRGFDCVSPVIHEFSLQAMAHDLLDIQDDIYKYSEVTEVDDRMNEISLTEADSLWCKLRHEHIANVAKVIDAMFETSMLLRRFPKVSRYRKLPELGDAVRRHLAFRKNQPHDMFKRMANDCMKLYCGGINVLADLEQDLASAIIKEDTTIKNAFSTMMNIFFNDNYSLSDKLRVFLLYIFFNEGITKHEFDNIISKCGLPFSEARIITNVLHLDVDIFRPGFCKSVDFLPTQRDEETVTYKQSRWVPAIKNIILSCINGSLCQEKYPYIDNDGYDSLTTIQRSGYWCSDKKDKYLSRLIIFIAGGITYSEMRAVYEVMNKNKGWEVYIGGDVILTPKKFLNKLKELRCFISKNVTQ